jgi:UMF1 family MFS transporter
MMLVDVDRGRTEGAALAKTLEQLSRARDTDQIHVDDNLSQEVRDDLRSSFSYQRS